MLWRKTQAGDTDLEDNTQRELSGEKTQALRIKPQEGWEAAVEVRSQPGGRRRQERVGSGTKEREALV